MGHSWSGFAASLALSISMLPTITRTAEEVLRLVPDGLREASLALGTTEWRTVRGVVLPTARAGPGHRRDPRRGPRRGRDRAADHDRRSATSVMNANPFAGAQMSLPLYIYRNYQLGSPVPLATRHGPAALVLITLVARPVHHRPRHWAAGPARAARRSEAVLEALETAAPAD